MATLLSAGSTPTLFETDFEGTEFFDEPQEGGGIFAAGLEDSTNLLIFGEGNDVAAGGSGTDIIQGLSGDDNLQGAGGTDFVFGGFGDDIVRGGAGDDVVVGNEGSDLLIAGDGSDVFEFFADQFQEGDIDVILDFELGEDAVVIVGSTDVSYDPLDGFISVDGAEVAFIGENLDSNILIRENSAVIF